MNKIIVAILFIALITRSCNNKVENEASFVIREIKYITHNSAIVYAEVTGTESPFDIWEKGICYAEHGNPTLEDSSVKDWPNVGKFKSCLSGLNANTTYFIRVFAKTPDGIFYSKQQSFKTKDVDYFIDIRDGQKYPIITIGSQTWFAANLNYRTNEGSYYFQNDSITYAKEFGRLYTYEAALQACPVGWHLPTDEEWKQLEMELGMSKTTADSLAWRGEEIGNKMKEPGSRLWNYDTDYLATNESGFTIRPSGTYNIETNEFSSPGYVAMFWTSTPNNDLVYTRFIQVMNGKIQRYYVSNTFVAYSIRCIKD
jgi:uncharacterized protein (TIGR02145 family)